MSDKRYTQSYCGICNRSIDLKFFDKGRYVTEKKQLGKMGLVFILGHSKGGWGRREDLVTFSEEICTDCYDEFVEKAQPILNMLAVQHTSNKNINEIYGSHFKWEMKMFFRKLLALLGVIK